MLGSKLGESSLHLCPQLISSFLWRFEINLQKSSLTRGEKKTIFKVKKHSPSCCWRCHPDTSNKHPKTFPTMSWWTCYKLRPLHWLRARLRSISRRRAGRFRSLSGSLRRSISVSAPCQRCEESLAQNDFFFFFLELQFTPPPFRLSFHSIPPSLYLSFIHRLSLTFFHSLHLPLWIYIQRALKLQFLLKK